MLWSDPDDTILNDWEISPRGAGYLFGKRVVDQFCQENGIHLIARAHQLVQEGYTTLFEDKLVTVWSAPNYCYRCGNLASILELDENLRTNFIKFDKNPKSTRELIKENGRMPDYFL